MGIGVVESYSSMENMKFRCVLFILCHLCRFLSLLATKSTIHGGEYTSPMDGMGMDSFDTHRCVFVAPDQTNESHPQEWVMYPRTTVRVINHVNIYRSALRD